MNILFRGKRIDTNEWIVGNLVSPYEDKMYIIDLVKHSYNETITHLVPIEVVPETVCQYTGLDDYNGNHIFEGDIFKFGFKNCVVRYDKDNARFMFYVNDEIPVDGFNKLTLSTKILQGNKFDNPELLHYKESLFK